MSDDGVKDIFASNIKQKHKNFHPRWFLFMVFRLYQCMNSRSPKSFNQEWKKLLRRVPSTLLRRSTLWFASELSQWWRSLLRRKGQVRFFMRLASMERQSSGGAFAMNTCPPTHTACNLFTLSSSREIRVHKLWIIWLCFSSTFWDERGVGEVINLFIKFDNIFSMLLQTSSYGFSSLTLRICFFCWISHLESL